MFSTGTYILCLHGLLKQFQEHLQASVVAPKEHGNERNLPWNYLQLVWRV